VAKCGRRPVLDEIKQREILAILTVGCSRRTAARYVGCAVSTIQNTADRDGGFAEKLRRAENQHEFTYLRNIQQAAKKPQYWRAAAWVLERVFPEKYARRGPEVITVDQIRQVLARFAEIIVAEVPVARYRQDIIKRLEGLTRSLCPSSQPGGMDHES
jgi:hypothetical protein